MAGARDLVREAFRTEERGVDWRAALAGSFATGVPLAIGLALDDPVAGLLAALGGLNAALCVPRAGLRTRVWWGALCTAGMLLAFVLADLAGPHTWLLVLVTLAWVGSCALLRAAGPPGALGGFAIGAVFVILAGIPSGPEPLGERLLWFAIGAAAGLALMVAARSGPERSAHPAADALRVVVAAARRDGALRDHALRLAGAVAAGTLLYRAIDLPHGYWVPLTTLAILQPGPHATRVRAVQRAAGTLAGVALILAITLVTDERWALVAGATAMAFCLYALDERGYFWLVVLLTPTALLMLSTVDVEGDDLVVERVANSAVGIAIGLVIGEVVWRVSVARGRAAAR